MLNTSFSISHDEHQAAKGFAHLLSFKLGFVECCELLANLAKAGFIYTEDEFQREIDPETKAYQYLALKGQDENFPEQFIVNMDVCSLSGDYITDTPLFAALSQIDAVRAALNNAEKQKYDAMVTIIKELKAPKIALDS